MRVFGHPELAAAPDQGSPAETDRGDRLASLYAPRDDITDVRLGAVQELGDFRHREQVERCVRGEHTCSEKHFVRVFFDPGYFFLRQSAGAIPERLNMASIARLACAWVLPAHLALFVDNSIRLTQLPPFPPSRSSRNRPRTHG